VIRALWIVVAALIVVAVGTTIYTIRTDTSSTAALLAIWIPIWIAVLLAAALVLDRALRGVRAWRDWRRDDRRI
jgi:purine-cytosine permease-like protein